MSDIQPQVSNDDHVVIKQTGNNSLSPNTDNWALLLQWACSDKLCHFYSQRSVRLSLQQCTSHIGAWWFQRIRSRVFITFTIAACSSLPTTSIWKHQPNVSCFSGESILVFREVWPALCTKSAVIYFAKLCPVHKISHYSLICHIFSPLELLKPYLPYSGTLS